ncbi:MAG: hypothetical protein ABFD83_10610 [Armatimonadota bacterium]
MKKALQLTFILMLASISVASYSQGKTSVDPSTISSTAASTSEIDTRLSQKITYDSGYKRLHVVTDDLSRISGVPIGCGRNTKDWRVRDIPLVVCVKDMPLGKLLRAIADSTHTWFASEKIGDNSTKTYRIYRRQQEEQKIDDFFKSRHESRLANAKWQWEALKAYGKSNEITWPDGMSHTAQDIKRAALLIATLGEDSEDRMLAGETFSFKGSDPAYRDIIEQMYAESVNNIKVDNHDLPSPTAEYIDSAAVKIKLVDKGEEGDTSLSAFLGPIMYTQTSWGSGWVNMGAYSLDGKIPGLPPRPKEITCPSLKDDMANPAMVPLDRYSGENWNSPKLKAKIDIDKPETVKNATFAELISTVAKASGLNIVTEDFTSHRLFKGSQ